LIGKLGKKLGFSAREEGPDWEARNRDLVEVIRAGDLPRALEDGKKMVEYVDRKFPRDAPEKATTYNNMGMIFLMAKDFEMAGDAFQDALAIRRRLLGERHKEVALVLLNLMELYRLQAQDILMETRETV